MREISFYRLLSRAGIAFAVAMVLAPPPITAQPSDDVVSLQGDRAEREAARDRLFAALASAPDPAEAQKISTEIWLFWFQAPDDQAAELMRQALAQRRSGAFRDTLITLGELVTIAPEWAEAWNQRATVRFLTGDFQGSLDDVERVLPLEPKHFGALAGQAIILRHLGRDEESQEALRRAVAINPFLAERAMLEPEPGRKI